RSNIGQVLCRKPAGGCDNLRNVSERDGMRAHHDRLTAVLGGDSRRGIGTAASGQKNESQSPPADGNRNRSHSVSRLFSHIQLVLERCSTKPGFSENMM